MLQRNTPVPQTGDQIDEKIAKPRQWGRPHGKALGKGDVGCPGQPAHRCGKDIRQDDLQHNHQQGGRQAVPHFAGQLLHQYPRKGRLPQAPQVHIQHTGHPAGQHQQVQQHGARQHPVQDITVQCHLGRFLPVQVGRPGGKGIGIDHGIHQRH